MKFEEIKKITAWELLNLLQKLVKENVEKAKKLRDVPLDKEIEKKMAMKKMERQDTVDNDAYKNTFQQNSKFINLHQNLLWFLKELEKDIIKTESQETNQHEENQEVKSVKEFEFHYLLEETLKGTIQFDSKHPFFENQKFIQSLIDEYAKVEAYEKCAFLQKIIKPENF